MSPERHPEPIESLDARFLAILLKASQERIELHSPPWDMDMLKRLQIRLHTLRRRQKDLNPELWRILYRTTVRWNPATGVLIIEPRDSDLDPLLKHITGQDREVQPIPTDIPKEIKRELDDFSFLEELVNKGQKP